MSYQPLQQDARDSHMNPPVNYGSAGVTTTATTHTDTVLPHTRLRPSGCASGTLAGFAIVSIVLSFIAFVLNVIPVGKGIAVYQLGYKSEVLWKERLFVPGIWLGVLEGAAAVCALVYGCQAAKAGRTIKRECCSPAFCSGWFLAVVFVVMAGIASGACVLSIVTVVDTFWFYADDTCLSFDNTCTCPRSQIRFENTDCDFARQTLPNIYLAVAAICSVLVIINIVISSLFCGALCCCSTSIFVAPEDHSQASVTVVNTAPTAGMLGPRAGPVTAYAYDPTGSNPPRYSTEKDPILANPV
ncbi:uncharacterized protein LOC135812220 [Sycon ciliatum]|uniref:uncharacterized protein LOC135812220 n=1 Tax=Sycon ciliatum TaxID=27933 RepID=UPI0031F6E9C1